MFNEKGIYIFILSVLTINQQTTVVSNTNPDTFASSSTHESILKVSEVQGEVKRCIARLNCLQALTYYYIYERRLFELLHESIPYMQNSQIDKQLKYNFFRHVKNIHDEQEARANKLEKDMEKCFCLQFNRKISNGIEKLFLKRNHLIQKMSEQFEMKTRF